MKPKKEYFSIRILPSEEKGKWNYTAITNQGKENHYNIGRLGLSDKLIDLLIELKVGVF